MALKCFSSVSTARPTHSKIRRACARCVGVARGPRQIAVMPSPTTHGVLGMARTIGLSVPSIVASCVESTPAAIETTSASGRSPAPASAASATGACAGLTHSTTTPAEASRCCTSGSTATPRSAATSRQVSADREVPHTRSGASAPAASRPLRIVHPITPMPTTPSVSPSASSGIGSGRAVAFGTVAGPAGIVFSMLRHLASLPRRSRIRAHRRTGWR